MPVSSGAAFLVEHRIEKQEERILRFFTLRGNGLWNLRKLEEEEPKFLVSEAREADR